MTLIWNLFKASVVVVCIASWCYSILEASKILAFLREVTVAEIAQLPLSTFVWIPLVVMWLLGNVILTAFTILMLLAE